MQKSVLLTLTLVLCSAGHLLAGGGEEPAGQRAKSQLREYRPTATPQATATALGEARRAVAAPAAPQRSPEPVSALPPRPKPSLPYGAPVGAEWLLQTDGRCEPLASLQQRTGPVGSFATPQEFIHKLQQRGHQAFLLPLADDRVQVKVPDLDLAATFVRPGLCP